MSTAVDNGWIDVSVSLFNGMANWPEDPNFRIERIMDVARGDVFTLSELYMSSHCGTHIDAPSHFLKDGIGIDKMPIDACIGEACVIEIEDAKCIRWEELAKYEIRPGARVLFRTNNSERVWKSETFVHDYVYLTLEAAAFLAEHHVRLIGIDYLSVESYQYEVNGVHQVLMNAGIWIIEGLNLSAVRAGRYELVCLPLRITNGDGSPARAVLRPITI